LCGLCVVLIGLALVAYFFTLDEAVIFMPGERYGVALATLTGVLSLAYPTVGALIASRLPTNPIGWIFCAMGLLYAAQRFATAYADYALLETFALPWGEVAAWFSTWVLSATPALGIFLMLSFPHGRLASRRWRIVAWGTLLGAALTALGAALMPGQLLTHYYINNPFGVVGVIGGKVTTYALFGASIVLGLTLLLLSALAALSSTIYRLRSTTGDERQQLKWFLFPAVPLTVFLSLVTIDLIVANYTYTFRFDAVHILVSWPVFRDITYVSVVALLAIPVCTYIAILRYRLYEIDIIINRSLVYGSLTAILAGVYFGGVTATQALFRNITGQEQLPQLVVVVSTLLIAALFNPLRRRIQSFIDRRFYRAKYDARKILEAYSVRLREETDLEALHEDLVEVVRETMQPAHVSLWLRPRRR
jgi:hypothetical protein